jgi:hypothetical protein
MRCKMLTGKRRKIQSRIRIRKTIVCFSPLSSLMSKLIFYQGRTSSASTSNSSLNFAQDVSKLMDMLPPWATRSNKDKDPSSSPKADRAKFAKENKPSKEVFRSKSQPKRLSFLSYARSLPDFMLLQSGQSVSHLHSSQQTSRR